MDEHDQDPELTAAIDAHPASGAVVEQIVEDSVTTDDFGVPTLWEYEISATKDALMKARQTLAVHRLNYFLVARVGGIKGVQPEQVRGEIVKLRAQIELLESFLVAGEIPPEPGLEVPGTPELVVAGAIPEGAGADS